MDPRNNQRDFEYKLYQILVTVICIGALAAGTYLGAIGSILGFLGMFVLAFAAICVLSGSK